MLNASHGAVYTLVILVTALCCPSLTSACVLRSLQLWPCCSCLHACSCSSDCRLRTAAARVWFGLGRACSRRVLDPAALPCVTCSVTFMDKRFGGLSIASVLCADDVVLWLHQTRTSTCQRESAPPCLTLWFSGKRVEGPLTGNRYLLPVVRGLGAWVGWVGGTGPLKLQVNYLPGTSVLWGFYFLWQLIKQDYKTLR